MKLTSLKYAWKMPRPDLTRWQNKLLDGSSSDDFLDVERRELVSDATSIQAACQTFMDSLPHRIIFVSSDASNIGLSHTPNPSSRRWHASSLDLTLENLEALPLLEPFVDPAHLDHAVRTDCNAFALHSASVPHFLSNHGPLQIDSCRWYAIFLVSANDSSHHSVQFACSHHQLRKLLDYCKDWTTRCEGWHACPGTHGEIGAAVPCCRRGVPEARSDTLGPTSGTCSSRWSVLNR